MTEIWKPIGIYKNVDFTGLYEVSNLGRIRSLPRNGTTKHSKILKLSTRSSRIRYLRVSLHKKNKPYCISVHSIVAHVFIGKRPAGMTINHIDGNTLNNKSSNLEYCSHAKNVQHAIALGISPAHISNENHPLCKKSDIVALKIIKEHDSGKISYKKLAAKHNISENTIISWCLGKRRKYLQKLK